MSYSITVGRLRQNPTEALDAVARGASYEVTKHNRVVARLVPVDEGDAGRAKAPARRDGVSVEQLKDSSLYTRERSAAATAEILQAVEMGRDRMGTVADQ